MSCSHETPRERARVTPRDRVYGCMYGQQLSIDTKFVALPWSRSQQHLLNYAQLLKTWYFKDWYYACTKNSAKELVWPHKTGYRVIGILLAFDFCRFCVVIRFFIPATTANDLRLRRIFYPRFYPLHLFSYLNSWERTSFFLLNVQC